MIKLKANHHRLCTNSLRRSILMAIVCMLFIIGSSPFATAEHVHASSPLPPPVEVFDVKQGQVVHTLPLSGKLKKKIINALNDHPAPYKGISMNPESGMIIHVRFEEPVKLRSKLYPKPVKEAYIFLDPDKPTLALLFFSEGHNPRVYTLEAEPDALIQAVLP